MKNQNSLLSLGAAALVAGCASTAPVAIPSALQPAVNETLAMTVAARGVQIYECLPHKTGAGAEWQLVAESVAPDGELYEKPGRLAGRRGVGQFWQPNDRDRIIGSVKARADAPIPGAIPWLLLTTKSAGPAGAFSGLTSIQRINTVGGVAPKSTCAPGESVRVPYTADYRLFTAN